MNENQTLDISWGTIFKIGIAVLIFYLIYLVKDILIWIIFALIISVLFNPAIDFLQKRKIPRGISVILVYILIFGILGFLIYLISPIFIVEIQKFTQLFPQYFERFAPPLKELGVEAFENFEIFIKSFQNWLINASANIFSAISAIFGGIFATLTIFILALFFSLEDKGIEKVINLLTSGERRDYIIELLRFSQQKVAGWFGIRILACIFVGLATYLTLFILKIDYPLALSIFAGFTNIIPIVGPLIAGMIITILAALDSLTKAVIVLVIFIIIQQLEGNFLTPLLTKKFIGLPSVLVLISLLIGGKLWGILGAILVIPIAGIIFEFSKDFLKKKRSEEIVTSPSKRTVVW